MTAEEMDQIIADMVRERRELRLAIVCMEERLRKAGTGFQAAAEAVRSSKDLMPGKSVYLPDASTYPDIEAFRSLLREFESAKARMQEIGKRLDMC